jgi:tRNA pseudouridine synthase 10
VTASDPSVRPPRRPGLPTHRVFLESRYQKLSRELPQTIFYCPECKGHRRRRKDCARCQGHGKLTRDSVQELLGRRLLPAYRARDGKFHGAGREDVDVLMLGRGRPFVYEVVAPRRLDVDLDELRERLHREDGERVRIEPFKVVPRTRVAELKEARFEKVYRLAVELDGAPTVDPASLVGRSLSIRQRTPQRVAHRRADIDRERRLTIRVVARDAAGRLSFEVLCAHGTYVKEWVSGDDGRTTPSLGDLCGTSARCVELDVLEIVMPDGA